MAAERAGADVIDPLPYLCGGAVLPDYDHDGLPRYLDRDHLRSSYALMRRSLLIKYSNRQRPGRLHCHSSMMFYP